MLQARETKTRCSIVHFHLECSLGFGRLIKGTSEIGNLSYQNRLDFG